MSRCGCDTGQCNCVVQAGVNVTVTGTGSVDTPYIVAVPGGGIGPTGPTGPTGATGTTNINYIFSYAGALASATTSPPIRIKTGGTMVILAVTLGTAGSTNTVLDILKNGVSAATVTITGGTTVHNETVSIAYAADTDLLAIKVTTTGTGAADMTAEARF